LTTSCAPTWKLFHEKAVIQRGRIGPREAFQWRTKPDEDYHELLVRLCLERLLYRLSISAHRERFVLKGAMLLALWQGFLHRRTRGLDLLGLGDPAAESVTAVFKEILTQSVPVDDGILFEAATAEAATIKS
jgi:hypothetical protein